MSATGMQGREFDFEKFRLRTFVDRLVDLDEVEIRPDPTPLTALSEIIENTQKAVLFKQAGPERVELIAKAAGSRKRLIAAFDSTPESITTTGILPRTAVSIGATRPRLSSGAMTMPLTRWPTKFSTTWICCSRSSSLSGPFQMTCTLVPAAFSSSSAFLAPAWMDFQNSCVVPLGMTAIL